jgi:HD-GYP domain-containing protein (c-di-GMP phosphodiesterase class II)
MESRIITIADSFDAMTHERPYREAMTREETVAEIKRCAGSQFDPVIAILFVDRITQI